MKWVRRRTVKDDNGRISEWRASKISWMLSRVVTDEDAINRNNMRQLGARKRTGMSGQKSPGMNRN